MPKQANSRHKLFRVSSKTSKVERNHVRDHLVAQACHPKWPDSIVVATKVFESSITLHINGVIDSGMAVELEIATDISN